MYSGDLLSEISVIKLRRVIELCLEYCRNNIGSDKGLKVTVINNPHRESCYGLYRSGVIYLYYDEIKYLGELTRTFIHEFTHHNQPIEEKYNILLKEYGYDNHPFEVECVLHEKIHNRKLLSFLRKNIS